MSQSTIVKTGTTILEQNVTAQGQSEEVWHISGIQVKRLPGALPPVVSPDFGGGDIYSVNFAVSDFAGLDWISAKTYTGIAKHQGKDCLVFKDNVSPLTARLRQEEAIAIDQAKTFGEQVPAEIKVPAVAYVDLETRLPLWVAFGDEKRIYQFGAPPQSPLVLPAELAGFFKEYTERIKRLSAPATKAY
jgi:hypothetical protein